MNHQRLHLNSNVNFISHTSCGKNSAKTCTLQFRFLMIGLTSEAIFLSICSAESPRGSP